MFSLPYTACTGLTEQNTPAVCFGPFCTFRWEDQIAPAPEENTHELWDTKTKGIPSRCEGHEKRDHRSWELWGWEHVEGEKTRIWRGKKNNTEGRGGIHEEEEEEMEEEEEQSEGSTRCRKNIMWEAGGGGRGWGGGRGRWRGRSGGAEWGEYEEEDEWNLWKPAWANRRAVGGWVTPRPVGVPVWARTQLT